MKITRKIVAVPSSYSDDELGYLIEGMDSEITDAAETAQLITHDLVEHSEPELIGTVVDEARALGVFVLGRGTYHSFESAGRTQMEVLASEFENLLEDATQCGSGLCPCVAPNPVNEATETLERIRESLLERSPEYFTDINQLMDWANWGAWLALQHYASGFDVYRVFLDVEQHLKDNLDWPPEFEGQAYNLTIDTAEFEVSTEELKVWYDEF